MREPGIEVGSRNVHVQIISILPLQKELEYPEGGGGGGLYNPQI